MEYEQFEGSFCPVCGLDQGQEIRFLMGEICSCCGTEYHGAYFVREPILAYRQNWAHEGYPWFRPEERPENWNPIDQLNQLPERYR